MDRKEKVNSEDYKATKVALCWYPTLTDEERKNIDIIDAYADGVIYGWNNPHWIPVEERKPPIAYHDDLSENHLVVDSDGELLIAYYDAKNELWFSVDSNPSIYDVTHWMPLPQQPRKEDKE